MPSIRLFQVIADVRTPRITFEQVLPNSTGIISPSKHRYSAQVFFEILKIYDFGFQLLLSGRDIITIQTICVTKTHSVR